MSPLFYLKVPAYRIVLQCLSSWIAASTVCCFLLRHNFLQIELAESACHCYPEVVSAPPQPDPCRCKTPDAALPRILINIYPAYSWHASQGLVVAHSTCQDLSPAAVVGSRLALVSLNGVQHDLVRQLWRVVLVTLTPVIAHSVAKDGAIFVEIRG